MSFVTTARGPDGLGWQSAGHWLCDGRRRWGGGSPTTGVVPAAADEVSALTATQFAAHAQMYQAVRWGKHTDHTKQDVPQTEGASDTLAMVWACESLVRRVDARSLMTYMMMTIER